MYINRNTLSVEITHLNMLKVIAALSLVAVCFGSPLGDAKLSPPIVGGEQVDIEDFPYQLALEYGGLGEFCGATIISEDWALTSAQCTTGFSINQMTLRAGSSNYNRFGSVHNVIKKIEHPQYKGHDYDYTLLQVDPPFVFGPGVAAIPLIGAGENLPAGTIATISGWGTTEYGGATLPPKLQAVEIPLVSQADCRDAYGSSAITDRMICAGVPQGGKDTCQGDSGGPLVANGVLAGVVSWGYGCAFEGYPGVYAYIPPVRPWIKDNTGV